MTAVSIEDYIQAQTYAQQALEAAECKNLFYVWALHRVAVYHAEFGQSEKGRPTQAVTWLRKTLQAPIEGEFRERVLAQQK